MGIGYKSLKLAERMIIDWHQSEDEFVWIFMIVASVLSVPIYVLVVNISNKSKCVINVICSSSKEG